jgi:hypothetical protein
MFVIFCPIATRNDDVCTRLYPIRNIAITHDSKLEIGTIFLNKTAALAINIANAWQCLNEKVKPEASISCDFSLYSHFRFVSQKLFLVDRFGAGLITRLLQT